MSRLPTIFANLRAQERKALMPFIVGGHPRPGDTARLLPALQRAGASVVEVGYPFSDPVADGPVIAAAMHDALALGNTVASTNAEIAAARSAGATVGIVAMVSISIVHRVGVARFIEDAKAAGVDGFIFPDVPLEESAPILDRVQQSGLTASLLIAPTTSPERAAQIAGACTGFIYLLARTGITGGASAPPPASRLPQLSDRIRLLRESSPLPIAIGFGISTPAQVRSAVHEAGADAAIVGSALVKRLAESHSNGQDPVALAETFTHELATGLSR
ncbi:MAG TPA: tryptophan synthase subunit alpha [Phycisphaerales bacterium]|nr:tryptophan synthase subunit alpha [Phycisphaerales bacterium]